MNEDQLQRLIDQARQGTTKGLWDRLRAVSGVTEQELVAHLNDWQGVAVLPLDIHRQGAQALSTDDHAVLLRWMGSPYLLVEDPWSNESMRRLAASGVADVQLALALPGQLDTWVVPPVEHRSEAGAVERSAGDASSKQAGVSVVGFVDAAVERAYLDGASDIHFESLRSGMQVKYRLDGVMAPGSALDDPTKSEEVISRIKVMAQLDITERRRPQDGRIRWQNQQGQGVDLRVSIMPSIFGEDAVLRLLDKAQLRHKDSTISLDLLGFSETLANRVRLLASRPHGMLLVTGPTGSGKTTTVYAALTEVNDGLEKIITIEDPVEYELPGVLQIPVNEQKGLTFATGLRSILRHDPDKILVGEIRDAETAQIAVQSALTGHLVFTTVHANSLLDVLGRFRHFGIEPFALASALNGVVVQRLLRRCCPDCLAWRTPSLTERLRLEHEGLRCPDRVAAPPGCERCRGTGYRGRFVLAEVHKLTDALRDMMLSQDSMSSFKTLLYGDEKLSLIHQAIEAVASGQTTLEEVRRVVGVG